MTAVGAVAERGRGFRHAAIVASSPADVAAALIPELRRAGAAYDEILLVVDESVRVLLSAHVGHLDDVVRWGDPAAFYQRLGFAYESFRRYLAEHHAAGRRVHVIAEPDLAGPVDAVLRTDRVAAYMAYESMCNDAYAPYDSAVTCVWTARHHSARFLDEARATHGHLLTPAGVHVSPSYLPPESYLAEQRDTSLSPVPARIDSEAVIGAVEDLSRLRTALTTWAVTVGFARDAAEDLVVAAIEVATNGLRHGAAPVRVRAWQHHDTLIVQCDDSAGRAIPATAGFRRPRPADALPGGRGLWLARQLADMVLIDSAPDRTSVRLYFPHGVMH